MKRTALAPISSKRRRFNRELDAIRPLVLARGCEFFTHVPPPHPCWPSCRGRETVHHAKGRQVSDANAEENLRCLCDAHHSYVTAHGRWAISVGLSVSRLV